MLAGLKLSLLGNLFCAGVHFLCVLFSTQVSSAGVVCDRNSQTIEL